MTRNLDLDLATNKWQQLVVDTVVYQFDSCILDKIVCLYVC